MVPRVLPMLLPSLLGGALGEPVKLIIDTDIGGGGCADCDDVGAVCAANAMADNGEVELLAVVHNTSPKACAGAISVLLHYYGRDDVPIGAYKGTALKPQNPHPYVTDLANNWPSPIKDSSQVPSALDVYRKVLAAQPDNSVVISSIGLLSNLADLLKSEPDQYSSLNGVDLVARKVKLLAEMGGKYPSSNGGWECNFGGGGPAAMDHAAGPNFTKYVLTHWPPSVKIIFSGFIVGNQVMSGGSMTSETPKSNPCRQAYIDYTGSGNNRQSWDPLTTLVAVRGAAAASCAECTDCDGTNTITDSNGNNQWVPGAASNQTYLVLKDAAAAGAALDKLYTQAPAHTAAPTPAPPPTPAPLPTPAPPDPCAGVAYVQHTNCFGNDIRNAGMLGTAAECCAACSSEAQCAAWTWWANVGPNKGQPWAGCWLKTGCPDPRYDGTAVSSNMTSA